MQELQKDLFNANDGDDEQAAKADSLVQKDEEFNQIKTDLDKALQDGKNMVQQFNDKRKKQQEDEESAKDGGVISKKRT